jgi:hypothetical protein
MTQAMSQADIDAFDEAIAVPQNKRTEEQKQLVASVNAKYGLSAHPLTKQEARAMAEATSGPAERVRVSAMVPVSIQRGLERAGLPSEVAQKLAIRATDGDLPIGERRKLWAMIANIVETRQYNLSDIGAMLPKPPVLPSEAEVAAARDKIAATLGTVQQAMPRTFGGGRTAGTGQQGEMVTLKNGESVPRARVDAARAKAATSPEHAAWLAKYVD